MTTEPLLLLLPDDELHILLVLAERRTIDPEKLLVQILANELPAMLAEALASAYVLDVDRLDELTESGSAP
jgi:hypothetical protein